MSPAQFWDAWRGQLWKIALVSSLVSGFSAFQVMAILTVVAYFRKRWRGLRKMREWEEEEAWDTPHLYVWEPPYEWEEDDDE